MEALERPQKPQDARVVFREIGEPPAECLDPGGGDGVAPVVGELNALLVAPVLLLDQRLLESFANGLPYLEVGLVSTDLHLGVLEECHLRLPLRRSVLILTAGGVRRLAGVLVDDHVVFVSLAHRLIAPSAKPDAGHGLLLLGFDGSLLRTSSPRS